MRSKVTVYILITALVVIWGIITFRIAYTKEDAKIETSNINKVAVDQPLYQITDSIRIFRDPFFLFKEISEEVENNNTQVVIEPVTINFQYIAKIGSKKNIRYIVMIDGEEAELKLGEIFNNIRLIKANRDFITVTFKGNVYEARIHQQ